VAAVDDRAVEPIAPEALLDDYPAATRATVDTLRALVREAVPEVWERVRIGWRLIGYDLPLRRYGVYFAYIAPEPGHVHLGFEWGGFMADPAGLLQGGDVTKQVRWLTFEAPDEIDLEATTELIREAALVAALTHGERLAR